MTNPKKMLVWDYYESEAIERLVIAETPILKYIYVVEGDEDNFYNNKEFRINNITHAKELLQTV